MPERTDAVRNAPHSGIRVISALAADIPDALLLQVGDPDFNTPEHIIAAAAADARAGYTKYTPSAGFSSLRELIADKVAAKNGIEAGVENIVVTTGGCGAIFTSLLALIQPGDEVLIPDPGWANNESIVAAARGVPTRYGLDASTGFEPDIASVEAAVTSRTRVLLVNSPGNPTGRVFGREALRALLDIAERHDLWVISDECYDALTFDAPHISTATVGSSERIISAFSFSKTYAMTGWRVGYVVARSDVAAAVSRLQVPPVANASAPSQRAAEAALRGPQDCVATMREAYRERRDGALALLDSEDVGYVKPDGAFYLMVDISRAGADGEATALCLLREHGVAIVPGNAFGKNAAGFARVALCADPHTIDEGLRRIAAFLKAT